MSVGEALTSDPPPEWGPIYDLLIGAIAAGYRPEVQHLEQYLRSVSDVSRFDLNEAWNADRVAQSMLDELGPRLSEAAEEQVSHVERVARIEWDRDAVVDRLVGGLENRTRWIGGSSWDEVAGVVRRAADEGWTLDELSGTIRRQILEPAGIDIPISKVDIGGRWAQRIGGRTVYRDGGHWVQRVAQTELGRVTQGSLLDAAVFSEIKAKGWVTVRDDRTRPAHVEAHGQIARILDPFLVGGVELMTPRGDGPPGQVIGCRCAQRFDVSAEEAAAAGIPI